MCVSNNKPFVPFMFLPLKIRMKSTTHNIIPHVVNWSRDVFVVGCRRWPGVPRHTVVNDLLGEYLPEPDDGPCNKPSPAIGDKRAIIYYHYIYYIYYYIPIQLVCNIILDRLPCWTARTAILFADL